MTGGGGGSGRSAQQDEEDINETIQQFSGNKQPPLFPHLQRIPYLLTSFTSSHASDRSCCGGGVGGGLLFSSKFSKMELKKRQKKKTKKPNNFLIPILEVEQTDRVRGSPKHKAEINSESNASKQTQAANQ